SRQATTTFRASPRPLDETAGAFAHHGPAHHQPGGYPWIASPHETARRFIWPCRTSLGDRDRASDLSFRPGRSAEISLPSISISRFGRIGRHPRSNLRPAVADP